MWLWLFLLSLLAGMICVKGQLDPGPERLWQAVNQKATLQGQGQVAGVSQKTPNISLTLTDCRLFYEGEVFSLPRLILNLKEEDLPPTPIEIGTILSFQGQLTAAQKPGNPGQFDYHLYQLSRKIRYGVWAFDVTVLQQGHAPYAQALFALKNRWAHLLETVCEPEDAPIYRAVVLGEQKQLSQEIRQLYQKNGISHLLAISGLHISLIGMAVYGGLRRLGAGFVVAAVISGCLLISYGVLVAGAASTVRAVMMLLCRFLADCLGRTYDSLSAAALAALLLLLDSPLLLTQSGFQLSFGAVLAVGFYQNVLEPRLQPGTALGKTLTVSLTIQLFTYPLLLYHFFQYPSYGIFLNLLVIPLMGIVVCSGFGAVLLGSLSFSLAVAALGAGHQVLAFYHWLCQMFASLPGYSLILGRPKVWQLLCYLFLLCLLFVVMERGVKWLTGWPVFLGICGLCFFLLWPLPVNGLLVTGLDVAQGDGMVLQTSQFQILVDCGSSQIKNVGGERLEPFLKSQAISKLHYVFVTHGDQDHISGITYLLESCPDIAVDNLVLPWAAMDHQAYESVLELAAQRDIRIIYMKQGDRLSLGTLTIDCLSPDDKQKPEDTNAHSLVLQVTYGDFRAMLSGDLDVEGEKRLKKAGLLKPVYLLKAGHHGSQTASCPEWVQALKPRVALLSYGAGNRYGHPHSQVVDLFMKTGTRLYHTAEGGAFFLWTDGKKVRTWQFSSPV